MERLGTFHVKKKPSQTACAARGQFVAFCMKGITCLMEMMGIEMCLELPSRIAVVLNRFQVVGRIVLGGSLA